MEKKEIQFDNVKPVYSDAIMANYTTTWKPDKSGKKAEKKEHMVKIVFGDSTTNMPVAYVVMNTINARNLMNILQSQLEAIEKDAKTNKVPEKPKPVSTSGGYIG
jgi:ABC-type methionine transport system ATPase subunit